VILHCFLEQRVAADDPLYPFLPLALAGFTTAVIFAVHRFADLFSDHDQSFKQHQSISKGPNQ
jgi:hypothetical protein